ncbi:MAG: hypothetical protein GVY36_19455 [Verrucomicrobia bacterium]|jgi:two-component system phosphate regulon response regulator PhoB|nr:hypothetical protein [Verrucomicrobiota bacterium]
MLWDKEPLNLQPAEGNQKPSVLLHASALSEVSVVADALTFAGFDVIRVTEPEKLLFKVQNEKPDMVAVCPGNSVVTSELLECIEAACNTEKLPILFQSDEDVAWDGNHVVCDTVSTGTNFAGLYMLSRGLMRRVRPWSLDQVIRFGALELWESRFQIHLDGRSVALGRSDFNILGSLFDAPDHAFDRETLLRLAFGRYAAKKEDRIVDVRICATRNLLKEALNCDLIETVRGVGYKLARIE